jgi:hypothetical protein
MSKSPFFGPLPEGALDLDYIKQWVQNNTDTFRRSIAMQGTLFSSNFVDDTSGWRLNADGSIEVNGDILVGANGSIGVGGGVPVGAAGQFFLHADSNHLALLETDSAEYPDTIGFVDVNAEAIRFAWIDNASVTTLRALILGPHHATRPFDIDLLDSNEDIAYRWSDATPAHVFFIGGAEVARFEADAGHNLQGLAWTTWTPTPTNFAVGTGGNAGITARYVRIGDLVTCDVSIVFGTTSNSVSGAMAISLPVTAVGLTTGTTRKPLGNCIMGDAGVAAYGGQVEQVDGTTVRFVFFDSNADGEQTNVVTSSTTPFTWGDDDWVTATFVYEAA